MTSPKPLINTQAISEFGDLTESAAYHDPTVMDRDMSYVPGFSEMRRRHAVEYGEMVRGQRRPQDVFALPVNLRWARSQNKAGQPDTEKPFRHGLKGYRHAIAKPRDQGGHIGEDWLKTVPPGCELMADGTIRRGDTVLMYCSREDAARSELAKRVATEERVTGQESLFLQNLQQAAAKGSDPTIEKMGEGEKLFEKKRK